MNDQANIRQLTTAVADKYSHMSRKQFNLNDTLITRLNSKHNSFSNYTITERFPRENHRIYMYVSVSPPRIFPH